MKEPSRTPQVEEHGETRVIIFSSGSPREVENVLASELEGLTEELRGRRLMLDFSRVERISSVELGTLVRLHKKLVAEGGRLTLFNLSTDVREVFSVCRLDTLLDIADNLLAG